MNMGFFEIIIIGIGLSMDAFAVSMCKGLSIKKINIKMMLIIGLYFGFFQAIMPCIGYGVGTTFCEVVEKIDHWLVFVLLGFIGINMIKNSKNNDDGKNESIDFKTMFLLAIATSIDALAVGVSFAFLKVRIIEPVVIIGIITFILSVCGVFIGNKFGDKLQSKAELLGGVVLILIGFRILLEHLSRL